MLSSLYWILGFGWLAEKAWDIVQGVFKGMWESISEPFDELHGLKTLVFNQYDSGEKIYGTFSEAEITNAIAPGVQSMSYIVGFFLVLGIVFMGVKISNTGLNPSNRTMFLEFVRDWVIVVLALANIGFLYEMIFMFNEAIVGIVNGEVIEKLDDKLMPDIEDSGLLGWIIVGLFMLGLTIWANFYYIMREITLMVLMILGPIFLALYIFPSTKQATIAWLKEFFGTVMIQSVHAITLFTIATISDSGEAGGVITTTIMYLIVIPTGEAIKSLLNLGGDMTGRLSKFAAMSGMAGLAGVYGAVKSATSGKSFAEAVRHGMEGSRSYRSDKDGENGSDTSGASVGPMVGTDTRAERMLRAGEIISKGGKMVIGSAGAIAGAATGPHGALVGGGIGSFLGEKGGHLAGRVGMAAKDKLQDTLSRAREGISQGKANALNDLEADKAADALADLQTEQWAKENYDKFRQEQELKHGGQLSEKDLNKLWSQKLAQQRKQFKAHNKAALLNGTFNGDKYARAIDLVESAAQEKLRQSLENYGRDQFVKNLPDNLSQEEIDKRWNEEKERRLNKYRNQAMSVAKQLTGNKPLDSFVDKDQFLQAYKQNQLERFDRNEKGFRQQYLKQHPNATPEEVDNAWNEARNQAIHKANVAAKNIRDNTHSISPLSIGANYAKSADLAEQAAVNMTKDWADRNEKTFKEKIRQSGLKQIEQEVETEWNRRVAQVRADYQKQAQLDTQNWAKANEQTMKAQLMKDNPNLTAQQLEQTYNTLVQGKLNENMKKADAQTLSWIQANESAVKSAIRQEKQQALESKVNDQWNQAVSQQFVDNLKFAGGVAQKVSGGQSLSAFIDQNQFSNELANQRIQQAKMAFAQQNPHLQGQELEEAWAKLGAENAIRQSSMIQVKPRKISSGYSTKAALAADFATKATDAWVNNPANRQQIEQKVAQDFDAIPENATLKQTNPTVYQQKLKAAQNEEWNKAVQAQFNNNMRKAESALLMDQSDNGVVLPNNMGAIIQGTKAFTSGFKAGSGMSFKPLQYVRGFTNGSGGIAERHVAGIKEIIDHEYGDAPPEIKAKAYRDKVAYKQGVLRGVKGYQKAAEKAMINNPYAKELYDSAYELSDIAQMAMTETIELPNGQRKTRIAEGAIQLVVERDRSYIQVLTKDGQRKTVSQYGAGDSTLDEGTVLFKDYNIENGQLIPVKSGGDKNSTGFYVKDTGGHKINVNRRINIDANSLLQTRRQILNQELEPRHDAYNYKVDQGQFSINDIKTHSADNKAVLVVERNRSYLAMNGTDNKMYRISPIVNIGNSNLKEGQVIYKEYIVEGGQLRERSIDKNINLETYTIEVEGNQARKVRIDSSQIPDGINVNAMVVPPTNKRFNRRQELERRRIKSGAYL
jgi:trimeric autotransporter adhesin